MARFKDALGSARLWANIGIALSILRFVRKVLVRQPQVVATEKLRIGDFVRIEAIAPPSRRERRAARK